MTQHKSLVFSRRRLAAFAAGGLRLRLPGAAPDTLEQGFASPPPDARPWTYWFWLNGNITRDGITADLEAMQKAGLGGVILISIAGGLQPGPVRFMTPAWRDMIRHAASEAARLGLVLDINNDDGWNSGGPWIRPEQAMQKMVWTETRLDGPGRLGRPLPAPEANLGFYRDIAVLAFPADLPPGEPKRGAAPGDPACRQLEFPEPLAVRSVAVRGAGAAAARPALCELSVSDNGTRFTAVRRFDTGWGIGIVTNESFTVSVPETRGRFFRLRGTDLAGAPMAGFEFDVGAAPRVDLWQFKAGFNHVREHGGGAHLFHSVAAAYTGIAPDAVVDLTARMDPSGRLDWQAPQGAWAILRIGHTPTGAQNGPATPEGKGLDCDKLSRAGIEAHFAGMMAPVLGDFKALGIKASLYGHLDSWECGPQNWTAEFRREFRKRRGYDLLPYLPVMAGGRVVGSAAVSERFLWDLRRTLADLIAENYWGRFAELCHAHGARYSLEPAGRQQFLYDPINMLSRGDLPMGEFWSMEEWARPDCKLAASAAHLYGKRVAGAEAFTTTGGPNGIWQSHPYSLKAKGDHAFCNGINRFVFHVYVHQPYLDRKPGLKWGRVGIQFDRNNTWWEPGAAWMAYLTRCQYLLQQGLFVADACYLTGEGAPNALVRQTRTPPSNPEGADASTNTQHSLARHGGLHPALPFGYDFDACNAESVLRMSVRGGRLELPGGMSYSLLVLPPGRSMTLVLLRKLRELVAAGATVVGPKPIESPSLADYPRAEPEIPRLAQEIWGDCDGKTVREHSFGKGKAVWGRPLAEVLAGMTLKPDFECDSHAAELDWLHRRAGAADIYFVSNQRDRAETVECTFRVSGRQPELWQPDTGRIEIPAAFTQRGGRTSLALSLDPAGSVFVVFRQPVSHEPALSLARGGANLPATALRRAGAAIEMSAWETGDYSVKTASGRTLRSRATSISSPRPIEGPWEVYFPAGWGAPERIVLDRLISWPEHPEDAIRHFSGSATYLKEIHLEASLIAPDALLLLDLGAVREITRVTVNGRDLGVLWKPPFTIDIAAAAKPGANRLEVTVTNLWPNRLIGDLRLPEARRRAWTNLNPFRPDTPLLESGLLGPVLLRPGRRIRFA